MSYEEFETMSQNAKTVINKFRDNPGKFAATILKMYCDMEKQRDQYKVERDTLIDDLAWYKAKVERLEWTLRNKEDEIDWRDSKLDRLQHENKRLTRLTHKLTNHRIMWDNLKDWRRDMLEIDKNDTQLISLGLVMDDLEKRHLYKGDE